MRFLLNNEEVKVLVFTRLKKMSPEIFKRNCISLLLELAQDLREEATDFIKQVVMKFIRYRA
jgi:hypothetical protein